MRSGDYITYYCRREGCSETKTEESQHTHTYDEGIVTQAATCGAPGVLTRTCAICGQQIQEEIAATGQHQYGEAVRDGDYLVMNCIICGHSESTYSPLPPENPAPVDPPPVESPQPETPVVPSPEQPEASSVPTQEPTSTENTSGIASSSSETTTE